MEYFLLTNPLDHVIEKIDRDKFDLETKKIFGEDLLDFYDKYGKSSFGKGLIQTLNPLTSQYLLEGWQVPTVPYYPIIKTSFGSIYFKMEHFIGCLDPVHKEIETNIANIKVLLNLLLSDDEYLNSSCLKDIHKQVYPRLGMLEEDEIYAFVPALALGGARSADNVEKVKMKEQLLLLSQL